MSRKTPPLEGASNQSIIANLSRSTPPLSPVYTTLNTSTRINSQVMSDSLNYFASNLGASVLTSPLNNNNDQSLTNANNNSAIGNNSFSNLGQLNQSVLYVNVKELDLKLYNEIVVSWNILDEETSISDFIGVYKLNSNDSTENLDFQKVNGSKIGHLSWSLSKLKGTQQIDKRKSNLKNSISLPLDNPDTFPTQHMSFSNEQLKQPIANLESFMVEFRYYSGIMPQKILAKSKQLKLISSLHNDSLIASILPRNLLDNKTNQTEFITFKIHDLKAAQLRKGLFFNPDPYVKLTIISNIPVPTSPKINSGSSTQYTREFKTFATMNTCFPNWKNETFIIMARDNEKILLEVKDKFAKTKPTINRFLGKVQVDMKLILEKLQLTKGKHHFTYNLSKRLSSDNVTGSLSFSISQITGEVNQKLHKSTKKDSKLLETSLSSPVRDQSIHRNIDSPSTSVNSNFQSSSQLSKNKIHNKYDSNTSHSTPSGSSNYLQSTSSASMSDSLVNSILKSKNSSSLPSFEDINLKASKHRLIQRITNNSASPSFSGSSSAASASSTCSDEASNENDAQQNQIVSSASSSSSSSSSSRNQNNQIRSSSVSTNSTTSSSRHVSSTSVSASNSNETVNQEQSERDISNLLAETIQDVDNSQNMNRNFVRPINSRSKSLDKIKYSKRTTPSSSPNTSFQQRSNIYLKNKKNRYGLSQSTPAIDINKTLENLQITPRTAIYLKNSKNPARNSNGISSRINNNNSSLNTSQSKSESNLTCLIRKSNQQKLADLDVVDSLSNSEIMLLVKTDLNSIVETLNESRRNNVSYEQIQLQVQKEFNEKVLRKIQQQHQHKKNLKISKSLKSSRSQSFPMIETLYYSAPKNSKNLEKEPMTNNSKPLTSSSVQNEPIFKNPKENVKILCQNSQNSREILNTAVEDTEDINLQNGIILIVEDSANSIATNNSNRTEEVLNSQSSANNTDETTIITSKNNEKTTTESNSKSLLTASYNNIDNNSGNKKNGNTSLSVAATTSTNNKNDLPQYWEARTDNLGRVFYIDHLNRTTTWKRPKQNGQQSTQDIANQRMISSEIEKQRLDKRYQSIRRTINQNNNAAAISSQESVESSSSSSGEADTSNIICSISTLPQSSSSCSQTNNYNNETVGSTSLAQSTQIEPKQIKKQTVSKPSSSLSVTETTPSTSTSSGSTTTQTMSNDLLLKQPGAIFILRSDLQQLIKQNSQANLLLKQNNNLSNILHKIRVNPIVYYKKYQHNNELVKFLNMFTDTSQPLPHGWEIKYERNSKIFFVDHSSRSTTYIDPRLPPMPQKTPLITTITRLTPKQGNEQSTAQESTSVEDSSTPTTSSNNSQNPVAKSSSSNQKSSKTVVQKPLPPPPPSFPPPPPPTLPPNLPPSPAQSILTSSNNSSSSSSPSSSQPTSNATVPTPVTALPKISYSDRVVAYLQQSNIVEILKKNNITLSNKQKDKLALLRQGGRAVYDRMSADLDLASIVSQLEDHIMCFVVNTPSSTSSQASTSASAPQTSSSSSSSSSAIPPKISNVRRGGYERGFHVKLRNFYRKLETKGYCQGPIKSKIVIRRDKLLEDAKVKFMQLSKHDLRKNKINICFQGEEGLDYGGPAREFFFLLSRELFNPYYGLFEYSASDMYTVQISPMSAFQEHALEWFQFAGRVLGVALIHQYLLDAFFTRPFYKALLRDTNWTLADLETLDPEYCQSLIWIKENDITDVLDLTFSVTEDKCGQLIERDLKENGRNLTVTERNKNEYLSRLIKWRVERGVQSQTDALVKGFYEVIEQKHVQTFDARELELVLCGTIEIDLNDWKKYTDYRSGYHQQHQVIVWFWQAVEKFDNEQKLKLLQFVTGTSSIPYEGFAALRGSNGLRKFCIERWGTLDALPRAHTCFNRLDLPAYPNFETLYEKILLAIEETSGFCIQ